MSGNLRNSGRMPAVPEQGAPATARRTCRYAALSFLTVWLGTVSAGCVIIDVGVTNPIPGLSSVAVAPFFNQSQERAVNGREVALAYYAELQKVPGFQVVPVGVTEIALREHNLDLSSPEDALQLARILGVDAVVVGSITDFDPYYPPRIGLTVDWYSPFPWVFRADLPEDAECPPVTVGGDERVIAGGGDFIDRDWQPLHEPWHLRLWRRIRAVPLFRGQSPEDVDAPVAAPVVDAPAPAAVAAPSGEAAPAADAAPAMVADPPLIAEPPAALPAAPALPLAPAPSAESVAAAIVPFNPRQPLMSYTRLFDGADAEFAARLRDYLEVRADLRSGSWPAAMRRTDEFVRFAVRLMVSEMLLLHGGEGRRRYVFKVREH